LRICYIADAGSIHTRRWVNYFAQKGHQVHIITSRSGEGYPESVRLHLLTPLVSHHQKGAAYINSLPWLLQTRRLINWIKPDIVDAHYITINGYLGAFSGFHPLVLTAWGSDILADTRIGLYLSILTGYALKKAEIVTCNSETVKREIIKQGVKPDRISIIYQGIDTQRFSPQPDNKFKERLGLPEGPIIISIRNFKPIYNVELLIRAIPSVLEHSPQVTFIIAGEGEQRKYLEQLAASLGCTANIRFVGLITRDELPKYLASADIYVSTSLSDSASLSLQEAMACETAPVVTDLAGNREWVTDGKNGFLVPTNDAQTLADKIVYLLKNEAAGKNFGRLGRKTIQERAEYEQEMGQMEKLYQSLVTKDSG